MRIDIPPAWLVRKYNQPGPRYTSYPTALHFTEDCPRETLLEEIEAGEGPLSLYFHVPFCESLCWFCGCSTVTTRDHSRADVYLDAADRELDLTLQHLRKDRPVVQLHLGGGTPNFLDPEQIARFGQSIRRRFGIVEDAEMSVELDPRRLTREHLAAFREMGINRASFGIQDTDPEVQAAINRDQPQHLNERAMGWLRDLGYQSVNIDLIYGLPHQTPEGFAHTLDSVLALKPDRLAVFNYAHVPWMKPAQKLLERDGALPEAETKLRLLRLIVERLVGAGYTYIGMDHFARGDDELARSFRAGTLQRNFQGYSTRAGADILAFGMTAISQTRGSYRQNQKTLDDYYEEIRAGRLPIQRGVLLTRDDQIRRAAIHGILCAGRLDFETFSDDWGIDARSYFQDERTRLTDLEDDGLVEIDEASVRVTGLGRFFIRNIAMHFDAYLARSGTQRYSKTI